MDTERKVNIIVTSEKTDITSESIIKEIAKQSYGKMGSIFYLYSQNDLKQEEAGFKFLKTANVRTADDLKRNIKNIMKEYEIDYFIHLMNTPDKITFDIKKINPDKHTFSVGFGSLNNVFSKEGLFDEGFKLLRKYRYNLLVVPYTADSCSWMIIYPEKRFDLFSSDQEVVKNLVETMFKRGSTNHPKSVQRGRVTDIPNDLYEEFYQTGKALYEMGLLPVVESGTYGNMSARQEDTFFITGRNVNKGNLPKDHLCRVERVEPVSDEFQVFAKVHYYGQVKPSTDTAINDAVYSATGHKAIVHIHTEQIFLGIPLTEYNYPCGTEEEMNSIITLIRKNPRADIIQLYKHGLIVMGRSLKECLSKIESLFKNEISIRKINGEEAEGKEFQEWRRHYNEAKEQNTSFLDINALENYYLVLKGRTKVGILYLKVKDKTSYFVFYSLERFTRQGLGLGDAVIQIVSALAKNNQCVSINVLTVEDCNVVSYYQNRGFKKIFGNSSGLTELRKVFTDRDY